MPTRIRFNLKQVQDKPTILHHLKRVVAESDASAELILFGSQARGDAHAESDWDVLVVTNEAVTKDYKTRIRGKLYELQLELGIAVGSLFVNRRKWAQPTAMPVYREIKKDGIVL